MAKGNRITFARLKRSGVSLSPSSSVLPSVDAVRFSRALKSSAAGKRAQRSGSGSEDLLEWALQEAERDGSALFRRMNVPTRVDGKDPQKRRFATGTSDVDFWGVVRMPSPSPLDPRYTYTPAPPLEVNTSDNSRLATCDLRLQSVPVVIELKHTHAGNLPIVPTRHHKTGYSIPGVNVDQLRFLAAAHRLGVHPAVVWHREATAGHSLHKAAWLIVPPAVLARLAQELDVEHKAYAGSSGQLARITPEQCLHAGPDALCVLPMIVRMIHQHGGTSPA